MKQMQLKKCRVGTILNNNWQKNTFAETTDPLHPLAVMRRSRQNSNERVQFVRWTSATNRGWRIYM